MDRAAGGHHVVRRERLLVAIAWRLPRALAYWAFVRVATSGCAGNPGDQTVESVMDRWESRG